MSGIEFVTDSKGRKVAVVIDLRRHRDAWEDFYESLTVRRRAREKRHSLESVRAALEKSGELRGSRHVICRRVAD